MSEIIKIQLNKLFYFKKGTNEYNAAIINDNKGDVPVYSGATTNNGIIGYTNKVQYAGDFIRVVTVGNAGKCNVISGQFCLAQNNGILILKENIDKNTINLDFVSHILNGLLPQLAKGDKPKSLVWKDFQNILIPLPIVDDKTFDINKQNELAQKYKDIEEKKKVLLEKIDILNKTKVMFDNNIPIRYKNVPITEIFTPKGGNMKLSKEWCKENTGKYPVYSGSTTSEKFGSISNYEYDGNFLTWVIDGLAGYVMNIKGKFSITCHRGILLPTEECKNIDLQYVKYVIEPIFRERARGRIGINGKNEYTALKPAHIKKYNDSIPIPIDDDGKYDLEMQQELAQKYATIETIKQNLYRQVKELVSITIK